jgi:hypothetical protein
VSNGRAPLGYPFTPEPDRLQDALGARRIGRDDFAILCVLWRRADRDRRDLRDATGRLYFPARCTLAQLRAAVAWDKTDEALSRRLRRLRTHPDSFFDYVTGGQSHKRYDFSLYPDARPSESCPSPERPPSPSRDDVQTLADSGLPRPAVRTLSVSANAGKDAAGPSRLLVRPNREETSIPEREPDSAALDSAACPSPSESQEKDPSGNETVGSKERLLGSGGPGGSFFEERAEAAKEKVRARAVAEEWNASPDDETDAASSEEADVLAGIAQLVNEGVLRRLGPCRYPSHRDSDWFNEGGHPVCGICHPLVNERHLRGGAR